MSISLTRLAWSMWGGRGKEKKPVSSKASALNSKQSSEWGLAKETKMGPPHRKVGRNKEERRVDREYDDDVVLVPCDNDCNCDCCLSGSESDDSDWSIGWLWLRCVCHFFNAFWTLFHLVLFTWIKRTWILNHAFNSFILVGNLIVATSTNHLSNSSSVYSKSQTS